MGHCSTEDFREKEVINVADGCRLGYICELEFDTCDGKIMAIVLPGGGGGLRFWSKKERIVIPWARIERIGEDVILVNAAGCLPPPKPKKPGGEECCG